MGSPSTKADCDRRILEEQKRLTALSSKLHNPNFIQSSVKNEIAQTKAKIAELKALKKTLK